MLTVSVSESKFGIILVYRPPNTDVDTTKQLINEISEKVKCLNNYVIIGDFNMPNINWDQYSSNSLVCKTLVNFCIEYGLFQMVNLPTRGNNILDLIIASSDNIVHCINHEPPIGRSDHDSTWLTIGS